VKKEIDSLIMELPTGIGDRTGIVFDIQPFSVHDGPGIRTLIFFKGCPLKCKWCSNPESQRFEPQVLYKMQLCRTDCGRCWGEPAPEEKLEGSTHRQAINLLTNQYAGKIITRPEDILLCPYKALQTCGRMISLEELLGIIEKDRPFFGEEGGITLTGGEPFAQPAFLFNLLHRTRKRGIFTAIETCLHVPFIHIEQILPLINFFMFDIKIMDPGKHKEYCGVDNRLILDNIRTLARMAGIPILPRIPIIPGINDDEENLRKTAEFLKSNGLVYLNLLPYMRLGVLKYQQIGREYELKHIKAPSDDEMSRVKTILEREGIFCL